MRPPGLARRASRDPLLKVGVAAMGIALVCVAAVAAYALLRGPSKVAEAEPAVRALSYETLVRSDPGVEPWKEPTVAPHVVQTEEPEPRPEPQPEPQPAPAPDLEPAPPPDPPPDPPPAPPPAPRPTPTPKPEPAKQAVERSAPDPKPEPAPEVLPAGGSDWPLPTGGQVEATREPRRYDLPPGAVLGLTVRSIGLYDVPVLRSNTRSALDNGVIHARGTSMPWSDTPERNVYLAGHRLGWPGTGSHLVFYRLNELEEGDEISLKSRDGRRYAYRVYDSFVVNPDDTWVTGRVRGKDMLTLQTCTPIPGFQKRLIVRAERV